MSTLVVHHFDLIHPLIPSCGPQYDSPLVRVELVLALPPLVSLAGLVRSLEHLGLRLKVYSFQTGRAGLVVFLVQLEQKFRGDVLPLVAGRVILVVCLEQLRFLQRLFPVKQLRQQFTAFLPSGKVRLASGLSCNSAWVDFCPFKFRQEEILSYQPCCLQGYSSQYFSPF